MTFDIAYKIQALLSDFNGNLIFRLFVYYNFDCNCPLIHQKHYHVLLLECFLDILFLVVILTDNWHLGKALVLLVQLEDKDGEEEVVEEYHYTAIAYKMLKLLCMVCTGY